MTAKSLSTHAAFIYSMAMLWTIACSDGGKSTGDSESASDSESSIVEDNCPVGQETCLCTQGGTCDPGLDCRSGRCINLGSQDIDTSSDTLPDSGHLNDTSTEDTNSFDSTTADTSLVDTNTFDSTTPPVDTNTVDSATVDTTPIDTDTVDSATGDTTPVDTTTVDSGIVDTAAIDSDTIDDTAVVVDLCDPDPCQNDGACTSDETNFSCECLAGFGGDVCATDFCDTLNCQNGGSCNRIAGGAECACSAGYGGDDCVIDYCSALQCQNDGFCVRLAGSAKCECPDFYTGDSCEIYIPHWEQVGDNVVEGGMGIDITMNGDVPCYAYRDSVTGSGMTARCLNGTQWLPVGAEGFSSANYTERGVQIRYWDGTPFVANRSRGGIFDLLRLNTFDGIDWYSISDFSGGLSYSDVTESSDLEICDGLVYSAFQYDYSSAYVMSRSVDGDWTLIGATSDAGSMRLACDGATLYRTMTVADWTGSARTQIQVWNSVQEVWEDICDPDFYIVRDLETNSVDIAVDNGVPYVAIGEYQVGGSMRISVMKKENTDWEFVGESQFVLAYWFSSVQINVYQGKPIVAFEIESGKPAVYWFDGETWGPLGDQSSLVSGLSSTLYDYSLTVADDGTLWLAMTDENNYQQVVVKKIALE